MKLSAQNPDKIASCLMVFLSHAYGILCTCNSYELPASASVALSFTNVVSLHTSRRVYMISAVTRANGKQTAPGTTETHCLGCCRCPVHAGAQASVERCCLGQAAWLCTACSESSTCPVHERWLLAQSLGPEPLDRF